MVIPIGAERVVLLLRHSEASAIGTDADKLLTPAGRALCAQVSGFYQDLRSSITQVFGEPSYHFSRWPRSPETGIRIFEPLNAYQEDALTFQASLAKLRWFQERKAQMSELELIRLFLKVFGDSLGPDFQTDRRNYLNFIKGFESLKPESKFAVAVGHEVSISMAALASGHFEVDEVGFDKCEGVLLYVSGGVIVGAEKVVPTRGVSKKK